MKKLVHFALTALFSLGIASAQNLPAIDVFGGYSYLSFDLPANPSAGTTSQRLAMNGWDFSASVGLFHHLAAEADISGHSLGNCDSTTFNCTNLSYMGGARYNFRDRASKITGFVHVLGGRDNGTLVYNGSSLSDTSVAVAAGAGVDYWVFRHIGVQLGPVDYFYTRHLNDFGLPSQNNFRASFGVAFRFGGELFAGEPSPKSQPAPSESQPAPKSRRGARAGQPSTGGVQQPPLVSTPSHGMLIAALGLAVGPQEFDGAKILEIVPGGVAEMASLKVGDMIKSVDGKPIRTPMELLAELSDKSGKVKIGIQRGDFATETLILLGH
ncbi:MAG: outer membrane beta-barrel protein [Terriglobales bacterium]